MNFFKCFILVLCILLAVNVANADEEKEWRIGPQIGFSPYTGLIGIEIQKKNFALTPGLPKCVGIKYYTNDEGRKWYFGINAINYEIEENTTKDNVVYSENELTTFGIGFGYKWRFKNFWEVALGLNLAHEEEEYRNTNIKRTKKAMVFLPDITVGL